MLVFNQMPRRMLGDNVTEDIDDKLLSDPTFLEQRARRAKTDSAWIQAKTWAHLTRMSTVHPMQAQDLTPGEWVLIRRRIVTGKGQNKEAARWIGPGRVLSIESAKEKQADDRFGHLVHVSYNGRLWGCAPEQLRLLHPAAKAARTSAE